MATEPAGAMGQSDFLRLMTTQLTTQDPFNPVDNTQMVAQMAQFSQLAGISDMNKSLTSIAAALAPSRLSDAASWIGRSMLVESEVMPPLQNGAYAGEFELARDADQVSVSLVDENGAVVHSEALGAQEAGPFAFNWNGKGPDGTVRANTPLRILITATASGEPVATRTSAWTGVAGIQSPANGGATRLVTSLGLLSPEAAIRLA